MRQRAALGLVLVLLTLPHVAVQHVEAQAAQAAGKDAREAFRRGEAAYSAGNYETAVREWNHAYAVDPRPRIQYNLSQAYERMGQLENAISALKRFVDSSDPEDPTYSDANARLVALQQRLASTGVMVQGGAEGGSILVDGRDWGRTPRPDKITVTPGNHLVQVRWPSGQEYRTNVYVPPGQVIDLSVGDAVAGPSPVVGPDPGGAPPPMASAPPPAPTSSSKKWLWYGAGIGTAAVGVGLLGYGIARISAKSKCDNDEAGSANHVFDADKPLTYCDPDEYDSAKSVGPIMAGIGGALILGGGALIVVGALKSRRDDSRRASTSCGLGLASARCTLRF